LESDLEVHDTRLGVTHFLAAVQSDRDAGLDLLQHAVGDRSGLAPESEFTRGDIERSRAQHGLPYAAYLFVDVQVVRAVRRSGRVDEVASRGHRFGGQESFRAVSIGDTKGEGAESESEHERRNREEVLSTAQQAEDDGKGRFLTHRVPC